MRSARRRRSGVNSRREADLNDALRRQPKVAVRHILFDREVTNFTYAIENLDELVDVLARGLNRPEDEIAALAQELEDDDTLRRAVRDQLATRSDRNRDAPYGRRTAWYVLVRTVQPRLVVETGTHDGLGSTVILRALARNALEGIQGRLISIDLDPKTGWLVPEMLKSRYEQRCGDSLAVLETLPAERIDLAVIDSAHVYEYERRELELIAARSSPEAVVVSDNPGSGSFADFCAGRNANLYTFWERPKRHIHPGAGMAFAQLGASGQLKNGEAGPASRPPRFGS